MSEEKKKASKAVLDELDDFDDDEDPEDSDTKRIPTYERRRYAGTDQKLGKYGYICVLPVTDEEDAAIRKITPSQRRPLRAFVDAYNRLMSDDSGFVNRFMEKAEGYMADASLSLLIEKSLRSFETNQAKIDRLASAFVDGTMSEEAYQTKLVL